MFENWEKLVKENQKKRKKKQITDLNIWKSEKDNRNQSSGCVFKEDK